MNAFTTLPSAAASAGGDLVKQANPGHGIASRTLMDPGDAVHAQPGLGDGVPAPIGQHATAGGARR